MHVWSAETVPAVEGHTDITATGEGMAGSTVSEPKHVRMSFAGTWEVFIPPRQSNRGRSEKELFRNR